MLFGAEVVEDGDAGGCACRGRGGVGVVQHPAWRGVGGENPYSGVAVVGCQPAALWGADGVVTNNGVCGAVDEFWALAEMGFRYPRTLLSVWRWIPQCRSTSLGRCLGSPGSRCI